MNIKVASYNLYLGADLSLVFGVSGEAELRARTAEVQRQLTATDFPSRAVAVARLLTREQVDLVGLQEVTTWTARPVGTTDPVEPWCDFLAELTGALAEAGEPFDVHAVNHTFRGTGSMSSTEQMTVDGANVILRRRSSPVTVESEATGCFDVALRVPTIGTDVVPITRGWGLVDVRVGDRALRFVNTHTEAYDEEARNAQRDELLAGPVRTGLPLVVVGDFNAAPDRVGMPADLVDAWLAAGGDPRGGLTCGQGPDLGNEVSLMHERIDYIWVRDLQVDACRTFGDDPADRTASGLWPSDHAGVVATVELPA